MSYSHADAAIVRKLHRKLEAYRLPAKLDREGAPLTPDHRIGKIFRDREDLPAAQSLSKAVRSALDSAKALVVVCSPTAKQSFWVNEEIRYFKEQHPNRPILTALIDGEPEEAFPDALTGEGDPLAADLRKSGDGWRLGFLKIVAGIADLPLDALIQRDAQRNLRRVMAITVLSLIAVISMAVMVAIAIKARDEAQSLRQNSDAFIDELLTDGRRDLRAVGRIDILDNFNDRALRFYSRQGDPAQLPADSLQNWAQILHAIGQDESNKTDANIDRTLETFTAAHAATEELLARDPSNADRIFAHAQSEYWLGWVNELQQNWPAAAERYANYRRFSLRLLQAEPNSHRAALERGFAEVNIGIVAFEQGHQHRAGTQFSTAITWLQKAREIEPSNRATLAALANAHAWRFNVHFNQMEFELALGHRLSGAEISQQIADQNPDDLDARFDLFVSQRAIAVTRCELGDLPGALRDLRTLNPNVDELVNHDRRNAEWLEIASKIQSNIKNITNTGTCNANSN
ncbi:MAG: toll/interleukin-1 receptor domain-containing protein [Erythrobacter sp.]